jgi:aspartyl-tRNA(Asn)/glutamyl-tRNA(Gln) amidotransferase subunit A
VEVLAAGVALIEADELGAWAALCLDRAREEARAAEDAWRRGEPTGPLCGLALGVKDLYDTAGVETACGSALLSGRVPTADAEAVHRCREAGAIVVGKTRTHQFAWGITMMGGDGEPETRNPWDPERSPGGSSGGSGVAVATGMVPLALGTDTGGSIRIPAAWCRISGFKPTFGRVPLDGVWPLAPSLDHAGPMAADPAGCALLFDVLAGGSGAGIGRVPDGLRVGGPELLPTGPATTEAYRVIQMHEALGVHRAAGLWPARAEGYAADVRERLELAERLTGDEVRSAREERERLRGLLPAIFAGVDVIRSPVSAVSAPRWDDRIDIRAEVLPHTTLQDLLGLPACALPDGTQMTGPPGADALVLAAAGAAFAAG